MNERIVVPHFDNESDEADWWFEHRDEHGKIMAKAMEEGRTLRMRDVLARHRIALAPVTVQVDADDLERARVQAAKRGLSQDDYIRQVLHEALLSNDAA